MILTIAAYLMGLGLSMVAYEFRRLRDEWLIWTGFTLVLSGALLLGHSVTH